MIIGTIAVFAAVSCIQLYACYTYNKTLKAVSKGFIMLSLFWLYAVSVPAMRPAVVVAIVMSFAGDMLLLKSGWLAYGGFAFFFAHAGYVAVYIQNISFDMSVFLLIGPLIIYVCIATAVVLLVRKHVAKKYLVGVGCYICAVCAMSYFALLQLFCIKSAGAILIFAGSILFVASDILLVLREFRKDIMNLKHKYTLVMATYIFAQLFIVLGIVQISNR